MTTFTDVTCETRSARLDHVFCVLANLPVVVTECVLKCGIDVGSVERRECQNGASADRRFVVAAGQNRRQTSHIADSAECRDARFANQSTFVLSRTGDERMQLII